MTDWILNFNSTFWQIRLRSISPRTFIFKPADYPIERTAVESQDQRKSQSPISRASHFTTNQLTVEDARVSPTNRRTSSARNSVRKSTGRKTIMGGRKSSRQTTEEFDIDKSLQELKEKIKKLESEDKNDITYGWYNLWLSMTL